MTLAFLSIVLVIVVAGVLGGVGSAILAGFAKHGIARDREEQDGPNEVAFHKSHTLKCMVLGVVAASVVPMFLEVIAVGQREGVVSTILVGLKDAKEETSNKKNDTATQTNGSQPSRADALNGLLILFGFCAIAAVAAPRFLQSMERRLLRQIEEAQEEAVQAKRESARARKQVQILQETVEDAEDAAFEQAGVGDRLGALSDAQKRLLRGFVDAEVLYPTEAQLQRTTGMERTELRRVLAEAQEADLIRERLDALAGPTRWALRSVGRRSVAGMETLEAADEQVLAAVLEVRREGPAQRRPSARAIAERAGLSKNQAEKSLVRLAQHGLVAESATEPDGWRLRSAGRTRLSGRAPEQG